MIKKCIPALAFLLISLSHSGCYENGNAYGLAKIDFDITFASETLKDGLHITESGNQIQLTSLKFEIESVEIATVTTSAGQTDVQFDPDNPPAPYTNCHNGHCHSTESSNIYTFDEIIAELSGGSTISSTKTIDVEKEIVINSFNTSTELTDIEIPLDLGDYQKLIVNFGHVELEAKNITTGEIIKLSNKHEHEHEHEHEHIHGFAVSHPIELTITSDSEYEHDFDFDIKINAHFIDEFSEDTDFSELVKAHIELEPEGEAHDHD